MVGTNGASSSSSSSSAEAPIKAPAGKNFVDLNEIDDDLYEEERLKKRRKREVPVKDCPYLSTINRNVLDFDAEKVCSVTLQSQNVYLCLVDGKYF